MQGELKCVSDFPDKLETYHYVCYVKKDVTVKNPVWRWSDHSRMAHFFYLLLSQFYSDNFGAYNVKHFNYAATDSFDKLAEACG